MEQRSLWSSKSISSFLACCQCSCMYSHKTKFDNLQFFESFIKQKQEGQKCPKRRVAQAAVRLATVVIKFRNGNVDGQSNRQTNKQNYTNFERNLAMMVIYLPVKFEFD